MEPDDEQGAFDPGAFLKNLSGQPGVYRFVDAGGTVLYVGKARSLKKRVASYFGSPTRLDAKTRALIAQVAGIEVTVTHTENEALLLENNLIKALKPRYNVVLRDDKSYPYIYLSSAQEFPRLSFHRGARRGEGRYFGPYANAGAVRMSLNQLQKMFTIRPCTDTVFKNRSRPCLQYQIQRCSAPCVGYIDSATYRQDVDQATLFLQGRSQEVIEDLVGKMEAASATLDFELAGRYRDRIQQLKRVQQNQCVSTAQGDLDIVAAVSQNGVGCVQVFFIRHGHNLGNKAFFPRMGGSTEAAEVLAAFLPQYYLADRADRLIPPRIVLNHRIPDADLLAEVLGQRAEHTVAIAHESRGNRARLLKMAIENAEASLAQRLATDATAGARLKALQSLLGLPRPVEWIECFDISHTFGEATVASCVVFGPNGAAKSEYRRFNIKDVTQGDDYAAIHQAVQRRYARVTREGARLPDVILIDGGIGQTSEAKKVLDELGLSDICLVGVAKGPTRKAGYESLILTDGMIEQQPEANSPALHLIQSVRDEAHRFAIGGHRLQRAKTRNTSSLQQIDGIGAKRRQVLITHFGGLQGVARAGVDDLAKVPGISKGLAQKIYDQFHAGA